MSAKNMIGHGQSDILAGTIVSFINPAVGLAISFIGSLWVGAGQRKLNQEAEDRIRSNQRAEGLKGSVGGSFAALPIVFGKARIGGLPRALGVTGASKNVYRIGVAHAACHAGGCGGLNDMWIDDTRVTAAQISGGVVTNAKYVGGGTSVVLRNHTGTGTQTADGTFVAQAIDASTAYGRGVLWTAFDVTRGSDDASFQRAFPRSFPQFSIEALGWLCYDPRLDSTNGGSGSQRFSDPTTWAYSSNPALCWATHRIVQVSDGGWGLSTSRVDWPSVAIAANICDETPFSGPQAGIKRFACNGILSANATLAQNEKIILSSMAGSRNWVGGKLKVYAGAYRTPTSAIDSTWLRGAPGIRTKIDIKNTYNAVRASYNDNSLDYKATETPHQTSSTYETQDGGRRRYSDLTLQMTSDPYQAQYLCMIHHQRSRYQFALTLPCNLKALNLEVNDAVTVDLRDTVYSQLDLSSKTFRVKDWKWTKMGPELVLVEDAAAIYTPVAFQTPTTPGVLSTAGQIPDAPTSLTATGLAHGVALAFTPPPAYSYDKLEVHRSFNSGSGFSLIATLPNGATSYTDPYTVGATFYYKVRARTQSYIYSAFSSEASDTVLVVSDVGDAMVVNGNFEGGNHGWDTDTGSGAAWVVQQSNARTGSWSGRLQGVGTAVNLALFNQRKVPCKPGDRAVVSGFCKSTSGANGNCQIVARFWDSAGAYMSDIAGRVIGGPNTTYQDTSGLAFVPASAAYASVAFIVTAFSSGGGESWYVDDAGFAIVRVDDQRINSAIDGLNQRPAGVTSSPLTVANSAGGVVTITIAAFVVQIGTGTISYNSGSLTTSDATYSVGTTVYVYTDDPTYAGGARTYSHTGTPTTLYANTGRFYVGSVVIPARGGSGGMNEGPCVALDNFLTPDLMARDVVAGDVVRCMKDDITFFDGEVVGVEYADEPCIRLTLAGGAQREDSMHTPVTLWNGRRTRITDLRPGDMMAANYDGNIGPDYIVKIEDAGIKPVGRFHVGGHSYAAGIDPRKMIYTHNPVKP